MYKGSKVRTLTKLETISFLHRLKSQELPIICEILEITLKQAKKIRKDNNAFSEDKINTAIRNLELQVGFKNNDDFPSRDTKRQENCEHKDFKLMFKCTCSKILSENDLDELIEILQKKKESLKCGVRVFNLTANEVKI